jgi:peptide/nickel transport system permease protein
MLTLISPGSVNLLLSILVLSSVFVIFANLAVDLLYLAVNPTVEMF